MGSIDGLHVIVDGRVEDTKCFEPANLCGLMVKLAGDLDMKIILGPEVREVELEPEKLKGDAFQDEGGTSVYCMISTSHMAIHVWPLRKVFMSDIFSCCNFNHDKALETLKDFLKPTKMNVTKLVRSP